MPGPPIAAELVRACRRLRVPRPALATGHPLNFPPDLLPPRFFNVPGRRQRSRLGSAAIRSAEPAKAGRGPMGTCESRKTRLDLPYGWPQPRGILYSGIRGCMAPRITTFLRVNEQGQVAQVVEQRTENPRVVSATLTLSTFSKSRRILDLGYLLAVGRAARSYPRTRQTTGLWKLEVAMSKSLCGPSYRRHKPTGLTVVTLGGRIITSGSGRPRPAKPSAAD